MTLPASGPLSLSNIQTEFGGSNPISMTEYYGAAVGIPASGPIKVSDFYGKSSSYIITAGTQLSFPVEDYRGYGSASFPPSSPNMGSYNGKLLNGATVWGVYERLVYTASNKLTVSSYQLLVVLQGSHAQNKFNSVSFTERHGTLISKNTSSPTSYVNNGTLTYWNWSFGGSLDPAGVAWFNSGTNYTITFT